MTKTDFHAIIQSYLSHDIRNWVNGTDDSLVIDGQEKIVCERIGKSGFVIRYVDGKGRLHREDGPAYIMFGKHDFMMEWYRRGFYHRGNGASILGSIEGATHRYYHIDGVEIPTRAVDELLGGPYLDFTPDQSMVYLLAF